MTTIGVGQDSSVVLLDSERAGRRLRVVLLSCGILASLQYAAMNVFVPMEWDTYSLASQTVSELSAIDAPTRNLWVGLASLFTPLFITFGIGLLLAGKQRRRIRIIGAAIIAQGILDLYWPPMHLRGVQPSLTDTLHIIWSVAAVLFMMVAIGFGAAAFGRSFRLYSVATAAGVFGFGALTGMAAPKLAANLPTPWIGLTERISIAAFFAWVVTLAILMLRAQIKTAK